MTQATPMERLRRRQALERKVVLHAIRTLAQAGWTLAYVDDGGDFGDEVIVNTEDEALSAVFAVDASTVCFRKVVGLDTEVTRGIVIILGNDGWDSIADHSVSDPSLPGDNFAAVMDEVQCYCEKLSGE